MRGAGNKGWWVRRYSEATRTKSEHNLLGTVLASLHFKFRGTSLPRRVISRTCRWSSSDTDLLISKLWRGQFSRLMTPCFTGCLVGFCSTDNKTMNRTRTKLFRRMKFMSRLLYDCFKNFSYVIILPAAAIDGISVFDFRYGWFHYITWKCCLTANSLCWLCCSTKRVALLQNLLRSSSAKDM